MKTIQELYNEIKASQELKSQFVEAAKAGKLDAFLKEHGCEASLEEVSAFLKAKTEEDAPLSINELENSAGGTCNSKTEQEAGFSLAAILGIGCAIMVITSLAAEGKHVGQRHDKEGRLCNNA